MINEWTNWTGDQSCRPRSFSRPADEDEVVALLEKAASNDLKVRVAGAGHSFNDCVLTDGAIVSLDRMARVLDIDTASGLVTVEAGITLRALNRELARHGRALANLGDVDVQSIAGATATGTHGTGRRLPNLSAAVHSLRLVRADGARVEVSKSADAEMWRAARVNLGALGIVTRMTLDTVPAFTLSGEDRLRPIDEVLERLDELVETNEHFEFFLFPHTDFVTARTNNRVDSAPQPRSRAAEWMNEVFLRNHVYNTMLTLGRRFPRTIPAVNKVAVRLSAGERVDESYRVFASPRLLKFTETEYALARRDAAPAVRAVLDTIEEEGFRVPLPLEVRFVAGDDALLSPAHGRDTCYIAAHMFERMEWRPFFAAFEEVMARYGGRPHWGKRHSHDAESLASLYPQWETFRSVRARIDPARRFANPYVERVLGA